MKTYSREAKNIKTKRITLNQVVKVGALLLTIYGFMVSLKLMGASFRFLQHEPGFVEFLSEALGNPFIGLFVGLLATAVLQSSSTTTSIIVMLAAGFGDVRDPATISAVVPMILGANIGTALTSTIVALGHIAQKSEYYRAIAAASAHDFFNIFTVILILPLELIFGVLSRPAAAIASEVTVSANGSFLGFMDAGVKPVANVVLKGNSAIFGPKVVPIISFIVGFLFLFITLRLIIMMVKKVLIGQSRTNFSEAVFGHPYKSFGWGFGVTALLQSSSVTTSLVVPVVATNRAKLSKVFPFIMGANVGTTITALLVALLAAGENPQAGLAVAITHLLFNLYGAIIFLPVPRLRELPVKLARRLGKATFKNRIVGIGYIVTVFFLIPFCLIMLNKSIDKTQITPTAQTTIEQPTVAEPVKEEVKKPL